MKIIRKSRNFFEENTRESLKNIIQKNITFLW